MRTRSRQGFGLLVLLLLAVSIVCLHSSLLHVLQWIGSAWDDDNVSTTVIPSTSHVEIVDDNLFWPYRAFKTSTLRPPVFNITTTSSRRPTSPASLLITTQSAPWVFDSSGELIFGIDVPPLHDAANLRVQVVNGEPCLTFWQGRWTVGAQRGHGYGVWRFINGHGDEGIVTMDADINTGTAEVLSPGAYIDPHEQTVITGNSVLVSCYNVTQHDMTSIGGPSNGWVIDGLIVEIDLATQRILWTWSALQHVDLKTTRILSNVQGTKDNPLDFFHLNSIEEVGDEYLLLSAKGTCSVYLISRATGDVLWWYEGDSGGDFGKPALTSQMRWQHDARLLALDPASATISIFDNHHAGPEDHGDPTLSGGMILRLALPPKNHQPAEILERVNLLEHPELLADSMGSFTPASSPDQPHFLGFGKIPAVAEVGPAPDHELLWLARFGPGNQAGSYRAYQQEWHSRPTQWGPILVLEKTNRTTSSSSSDVGNRVRCYVSWNGATDVRAWRVYTRMGSHESLMGTAPHRGFETTFELDLDGDLCVRVAPIFSDTNHEGRSSNSVCTMM